MNKFLNPKSYIKYLLSKSLLVSQPIINIIEANLSKKIKLTNSTPVFIIGAPRTGSTVLYQAITNQLDTLYFDNLVCKLYRNIFFGIWLSNKLFKNKAHNCSHAIHGNTSSCGLRAPSECGQFWYRWLPTNKHFIDNTDISKEAIKEIRNEISAPLSYFNKPMIFKNLNNGQRLRFLSKCFPEAKFIFIKRDPLYTAQSIIRAKRELNIDDNEFWSVMPRNVESLREIDGFSQVIQQIFFIEKQIEKDRHLFPKESFLDINYSEMADINEVMEKLKKFITPLERESYKRIIPQVEELEKLQPDEMAKLRNEVSKLDWLKYDIK